MVKLDLIKKALYVKVLKEVREEAIHTAGSNAPGGWNDQYRGLCLSSLR